MVSGKSLHFMKLNLHFYFFFFFKIFKISRLKRNDRRNTIDLYANVAINVFHAAVLKDYQPSNVTHIINNNIESTNL